MAASGSSFPTRLPSSSHPADSVSSTTVPSLTIECRARLARMASRLSLPQCCLVKNHACARKNLKITWLVDSTKSRSSKSFHPNSTKNSDYYEGSNESSSTELCAIESPTTSFSSSQASTRMGLISKVQRSRKRCICDPTRWCLSRSCRRLRRRQFSSGYPMALSRSTSLIVAS